MDTMIDMAKCILVLWRTRSSRFSLSCTQIHTRKRIGNPLGGGRRHQPMKSRGELSTAASRSWRTYIISAPAPYRLRNRKIVSNVEVLTFPDRDCMHAFETSRGLQAVSFIPA